MRLVDDHEELVKSVGSEATDSELDKFRHWQDHLKVPLKKNVGSFPQA